MTNDNNDNSYTEMMVHKEQKLKAEDLKNLINTSVKECFEDYIGTPDPQGQKLPSDTRIRATERRLGIIETGIDEMSRDSLTISRRVLKLSTKVADLDKELTGVQGEIVLIKDRATALKETTAGIARKKEKKMDIRRDTIIRLIIIIISLTAIIISIYSILTTP